MYLKSIVVAGSLVLATSVFAQEMGNPPYSNPRVTQPGVTPWGVTQDGVAPRMQGRNLSMPGRTGTNTFQGAPNNSTGNMNTRGAGPGTTGTGGPGGSGNR
jgi:hypothetical protein